MFKTQRIRHTAFNTCGCSVRKEETHFYPENGDPVLQELNILGWDFRCPTHQSMDEYVAYEKICDECKIVSSIQEEIKAKAPESEKVVTPAQYDGEDKISDEVIFLKDEITIEFGENIKVILPENLKSLINSLDEREGVIYG